MGTHNVTITGHGTECKATLDKLNLSGVFSVQLTNKFLEFIGFDYHGNKNSCSCRAPDYVHLRCFL